MEYSSVIEVDVIFSAQQKILGKFQREDELWSGF